MPRPPLTDKISLQDFQDFYWLKEELIDFCRFKNISTQGGKLEIAQRITEFLQHGSTTLPPTKPKITHSNFDWNTDFLSLDTVITDTYKNTEHVRLFFTQQLGKPFRFNTAFMRWMKGHAGATLHDALAAWHTIAAEKKQGKKTAIAPQFEYNTYIRDFLNANPQLDLATARAAWNKKKLERGSRSYASNDLSLLSEPTVNP